MKHQNIIEILKAFDKDVKEKSLKVYSEDYIRDQNKDMKSVTVIIEETKDD